MKSGSRINGLDLKHGFSKLTVISLQLIIASDALPLTQNCLYRMWNSMIFSKKIVIFISTALKNSRFRHLSTFLLSLLFTSKTQCNSLVCFTKERTAIPSSCFEINFVYSIVLRKALMLSKTLLSNI